MSTTNIHVVPIDSPHPGPGCGLDDFNESLRGCCCSDGCMSDRCQCQTFGRNYGDDGTLRFSSDSARPLIECGSDCVCSSNSGDCCNRVVQKGPIQGLQIVQVVGKGLGVRTSTSLTAGRFVCEYIGEVIGMDEARRRFAEQRIRASKSENKQHSDLHNYIFAVKEHCDEKDVLTTIIDPSRLGNIGRYLNHSCTPNLDVFVVRYDIPVARIAFFTNRMVESGEELTYSYWSGPISLNDTDGGMNKCNKPCLCAAQSCRKYLPSESF